MLTQDEMLVLFRDMMTAIDVGQKAEMGYYDVEIDTYGCTHYQNGERYYHLSANASKIYDYFESAALSDCCPTALVTRVFKKPIPRGLKDMLALEQKKDLALEMQAAYSPDFFLLLHQLARQARQNGAADPLNDYMDTLECTFDRVRFDLFAATLDQAVSAQKLLLRDHQQLLNRLNEERQSMANELQPHDIFHQTFHAFAAEDAGGTRQFIYDARRDFVYAKRQALEEAGALITPLVSQTCFYNYDYRLTDARRDFVSTLPALFDDRYFHLLHTIKGLPSPLSPADLTDALAHCDPACHPTLTLYGHRWQIL